MGLKKINQTHIDTSKISYIGELDTLVLAHINRTIHFFPVVVDGNYVKIQFDTKEDAVKAQENLIEDVNRVVGYLPG